MAEFGWRPFTGRVWSNMIARDIVVAGFAAVGVGVNCDVTAARVEQDASVHAAVDRTYGGPGFYRHAGGGLHHPGRRLGRHPGFLKKGGRARRPSFGETIARRAIPPT